MPVRPVLVDYLWPTLTLEPLLMTCNKTGVF
jgi:hypothetical protein